MPANEIIRLRPREPWAGVLSTYEQDNGTSDFDPERHDATGCWGSFTDKPRRSYHGGALANWTLRCDECRTVFTASSLRGVVCRAQKHKETGE